MSILLLMPIAAATMKNLKSLKTLPSLKDLDSLHSLVSADIEESAASQSKTPDLWWSYALCDEDHTKAVKQLVLRDQGVCSSSQLGSIAGAAVRAAGMACALVVPEDRLSSFEILLPARRRAPLLQLVEGILEEALLDAPADLHFSLAPNWKELAAAGLPSTVLVCDRAWLSSLLMQLAAVQLEKIQIIPAYSLQLPKPSATPANYAEGINNSGSSDRSDVGMPAVDSADERDERGERGNWQAWQLLVQAWQLAQQSGWNMAQFSFAPANHSLKKLTDFWRNFFQAPAWFGLRLGVLALLLSGVMGVNLYAHELKKNQTKHGVFLQQRLQQAFPEILVVINPLAQMERALVQLRQQAGILSASDLETQLSREQLSFRELRFRDGQLELQP